MNPDYTTARSADGPMVYRWVLECIPVGSLMLKRDRFAETVRSWGHEGRLVGIDALDRNLTPVAIHLSELPEDCWRWSHPSTPKHLRPTCERVVREWLAGAPAKALARRYGVNRSTVKAWTDDLRDLARGMDEQGQQADGHGAPVPHPDRNPTANGRSGKAPGATHISSPAPGADLSEVAA